MRKIICGSGHRPPKLGGFGKKAQFCVYKTALYALLENNPDFVISGMALGWDQALAYAAIQLKIPFVAAIPFEGAEKRWQKPSQRFFHHLCDKAYKVKIISDGDYTPEKMQIRNQWMRDKSSHGLILWDGTNGGTGNFVNYASETDLPMINYWEKFEDFSV